jgi:hypothetical protein
LQDKCRTTYVYGALVRLLSSKSVRYSYTLNGKTHVKADCISTKRSHQIELAQQERWVKSVLKLFLAL